LFHNKNFYFQIQTKIPLSWMVLVAIAFGQNPPVFDCPLSQVDFVAVNMSLAPSVGPAGYDCKLCCKAVPGMAASPALESLNI
jgi:hypothetical protein